MSHLGCCFFEIGSFWIKYLIKIGSSCSISVWKNLKKTHQIAVSEMSAIYHKIKTRNLLWHKPVASGYFIYISGTHSTSLKVWFTKSFKRRRKHQRPKKGLCFVSLWLSVEIRRIVTSIFFYNKAFDSFSKCFTGVCDFESKCRFAL